ncbi:putative DNA modification/repair radical SAM protein [Arthrospiribacter ruber]|uniref:DNA modification/repair radical SAM protein n=1 Tax=Arthrospiribacter ruber TaxID=2487934 RepID=A0A951J089_9BACT|nr:putative DNA modification/repair radical SAM protein [Arthrospiribacter ruber]MBW3468977.1 putative DNA modification/repair radical SAM protein [Arthrospiribacter ruber]
MNWDRVKEKLEILADAAKYDVSCSSSGSKRKNPDKMLGDSSGMGICHTYTEDGRCVSLLKILLTNHCIYDCLYCVSRKSNDIKRAAFTVDEVIDLTIGFYRRNYIEGLFLSSGIFKNADYTMERLVRIAKKLREEHRFNGYIHLKTIPGASNELMRQAGAYADRLSVNMELPTVSGLKLLAPEKDHKEMIKPMESIKNDIIQFRSERKLIKSTPKFAPAGQSSQLIIGATNESDLEVIQTSTSLYKNFNLKRVYYSGYVPVLAHQNLPQLGTPVPLVRENRLYQTDWLMRFYQFDASEIVNEKHPNLDLEIDPKLSWALRNREFFPVDIQTADLHAILRIPGVGVKSAKKIIAARRFGRLDMKTLKKFGIAINRAKYFMVAGKNKPLVEWESDNLRRLILQHSSSKYRGNFSNQLSLFS